MNRIEQYNINCEVIYHFKLAMNDYAQHSTNRGIKNCVHVAQKWLKLKITTSYAVITQR